MARFYQAFPLSVCCIRLDRSADYTCGKVRGIKLCLKPRIDIAYQAVPCRDRVA